MVLRFLGKTLIIQSHYTREEERLRVFYGSNFLENEELQRQSFMHPIKVEYFKMINNKDLQDRESYGIHIIKTQYIDDKIKTEEKEIKNLTNDEAKINKILDLFKKHTVTPIIAEDIVEDLLKQEL